MNQPLVVAGEKAADAADANPIPISTARARAIHFMRNPLASSDALSDLGVYNLTAGNRVLNELGAHPAAWPSFRKVNWPRSGRFRCWCRRPDSNRNGLPHTPLKRTCLPIPPRRHDASLLGGRLRLRSLRSRSLRSRSLRRGSRWRRRGLLRRRGWRWRGSKDRGLGL